MSDFGANIFDEPPSGAAANRGREPHREPAPAAPPPADERPTPPRRPSGDADRGDHPRREDHRDARDARHRHGPARPHEPVPSDDAPTPAPHDDRRRFSREDRRDEPRPDPRREARAEYRPDHRRDDRRDAEPPTARPQDAHPDQRERPWRTDRPHRDERPRPAQDRPLEDRHERHRHDHDRRGPRQPDHRRDREDRERALQPRRPEPPPAAPPIARETVCLLIDLVALQVEARAQGGEVAFRRLRAGLAGDRQVDRALCFAPADTAVPPGFHRAPVEDSIVGGIRFAATAFELLGRSGLVVMAPASEAIRTLATALRKAGHRVELAGFGVDPDALPDMRRLSRDCLFIP